MKINNISKIPNTIMRELTHHDRRVRKKLSGKLLNLFRKQLSHSGKKCDLLELRRLVSEFIQQRLHFQSARSMLRQLRHQLGCAALATALLATLGVAPAYAVSFAAQTGDNNSFNGVDVGLYSTPTFVDIDNDGDIDVFIGAGDGNINYYKNTGSNSSPTFTAQTGDNNSFNGVDFGAYSTPTFVDIDNDGDFDAFIGKYAGSINYYKNTGSNSSPTFTEQTGGNNPFNGVDVGNLSTPTFVDIDNDGDFDVFIGEHAGNINYYKNTGSNSNPTFTAQTGDNNSFNGVDVGGFSAPTFVDIDNDGDFDAFIGEYTGTINYYENTGSNSSPTFTEQTGGNNPFNGVDVGANSIPTFVDIDNDGDFDVFIGEKDGNINYYKNRHRGQNRNRCKRSCRC
jgi:hypothetical protein